MQLLLKVGDPQLAVSLANALLDEHGIYVQPINYPTVKRGEEMLRVAPTPHHTRDMMNHFVNAVISVWMDHGMDLKSCHSVQCEFCKKPLKFEAFAGESGDRCNGVNCNDFLLSKAII